jgi:hypothetical protein
LRIGITMNCITTVTTAMLVSTRIPSGILTSSGARTTDMIYTDRRVA